ncbi:ubinuclein-1 isoform X2 [Mixophyes fleayi]|uniref:ubinuclein-1 isoform X2 n=1 Tax=Mixophyes fleayi TaxID=3061075 RepID=UPI003F4E066D
MAESRRLQLSCISPAAPPHPPAPKRPRNDDQDSEPPVAATVRIALSLFEPDQKRCPEFCYPELLKNLQGNSKKIPSGETPQKKPLNLPNYEEAERKEAEDLAQKFEEKYGKKKLCRDRVQDLIDMGYGYDESDSFIDNSEAYDELVPASLTTKYGGFYINSGTLQFRQASESEDELVKKKKKKSPKKMKERGDKVKKRKREEDRKGKRSRHPKLGFTALNGTKDKKKKKNPMSHVVREMLAKFQREKDAQNNKSSTSATPTPPALPPPPLPESRPAPELLLPSTVPETTANPVDSKSPKDLEKLSDVPPERGCTAGETRDKEFKRPPSIPEGLPPSLEKQIKELTKTVRVSEGDKNILFTPEVNTALLDICLLCQGLSSGLRSAVFTHLSSVLPCTKDTLLKWATRLYLQNQKQGGRLQEPLQKLKEAVAKAMPEQINKYHEECKVYNKAKYAKMLAGDKEKEQKMPSEEEEEDDKASKKAAGPRKKFQWTDEIRQLLCQLVRGKVEMCETEGRGVPSLEDYFKTYLDVEVKPLWPRGWMQARTLFKESRRLYPQLSSIMAKTKATTPPKVKVKESSNKQDKNVSPCPIETQVAVITTPVLAKDSLVPSSIISSSGGSLVTKYTQDNSLDGDLILHPPSLDAVSEHLTALASRTCGISFDFSTPKSPPGAEKTTVAEDKKKPCSPVSIATGSQPSLRLIYVEQPSNLGLEKKLPAPIHSLKPMPEVKPKPMPEVKPKPMPEVKPKPPPQHQLGPIKTSQITSQSLQPSVKLYQMSSQYSKGTFTLPIQSGGPRVPAPSLPQRPVTSQTKSSKSQGFPPPSSSAGNKPKPIIASSFVGKHPNSATTIVAQVYRPPVPRQPVPPHSNSGNTAALNPPPLSFTRNSTTVPAKKHPHPPHKLTLMAPQDSGGFGVAKLLTSSIVAGVGGNATSPPNLNSQKGSTGSGLLGPSPALIVMSPSYKPNGGKLPGTMDLLSPVHSLPLHVSSFTTVPTPKPGNSKDAIVTGPAPGTFNHGFPRNLLLGGLHANTSHHSSPIPHPALSGHMQPAQTDGAHVHGKGSVPPQRKL